MTAPGSDGGAATPSTGAVRAIRAGRPGVLARLRRSLGLRLVLLFDRLV